MEIMSWYNRNGNTVEMMLWQNLMEIMSWGNVIERISWSNVTEIKEMMWHNRNCNGNNVTV